jgi:hypothetical protein
LRIVQATRSRSRHTRAKVLARHENPCGICISALSENFRHALCHAVFSARICDQLQTVDLVCPIMGQSAASALAEQIRCFFRCAVVIEVQCRSIRDCTDPRIAILNGLGGQHGEKSQIKDEVSSEEDGEKDEAPEEAEVDFATTFDFEECR